MTRIAAPVATLVLLAFFVVSGTARAEEFAFEATLHGAQEVSPPAPPGGVDSFTRGAFAIQFNRALSSARFELNVRNGEDITAAHLHCGAAGVNGPVVVLLFEDEPPEDVEDGELAQGRITNDDIAANDCAEIIGTPVNNIASLAFAADLGLIYVNVHTVQNSAGEIRGQLLEAEDDDD